LSAPARANAVIFGSQGAIEPSAMPLRISDRRPWSISDFRDLMRALMAGLRSSPSTRTITQPNSPVIATA
jgi:hypothetical protein